MPRISLPIRVAARPPDVASRDRALALVEARALDRPEELSGETDSNVLEWLANSPYAMWVDESWGWPLALTIHALGMAVLQNSTALNACASRMATSPLLPAKSGVRISG